MTDTVSVWLKLSNWGSGLCYSVVLLVFRVFHASYIAIMSCAGVKPTYCIFNFYLQTPRPFAQVL
jgi:hypothetical protein